MSSAYSEPGFNLDTIVRLIKSAYFTSDLFSVGRFLYQHPVRSQPGHFLLFREMTGYYITGLLHREYHYPSGDQLIRNNRRSLWGIGCLQLCQYYDVSSSSFPHFSTTVTVQLVRNIG